MQSFANDAYSQDVIAPARVEHRFEYGDRQPDGAWGYVYNYLFYVFEESACRAEAVHYLDETDHATIRHLSGGADCHQFAVRVLAFLRARYDQVTLEASTFSSPLPQLEREADALRRQE